MMLGEKVAAEEAERIGMIYKIFPDETFAENSMSIASYLIANANERIGVYKTIAQSFFQENFRRAIAG